MFFVNRGILKLLRISGVLRSPVHHIVVADLPEYTFHEDRFFELSTPGFQSVLRAKSVVFLFGRFFRDYANFEKHQDIIRTFFTPVPEIQAMVNATLRGAKTGAGLVVGIHIRRGDYAQFVDGKYFYSQVEYRAQMERLQSLDVSRKIRFIICSNESIQKEVFEGLDVCQGPGHLAGDMYTLAACDLIMGPPSTYTLWASFYGKTPLYQIRDLNKSFDSKDFVILPPERLYNFNLN